MGNAATYADLLPRSATGECMALTKAGEKCLAPAVKEVVVHADPEVAGETSWFRVKLCEMHAFCVDGRLENWPRYREAVDRLREQEFKL